MRGCDHRPARRRAALHRASAAFRLVMGPALRRAPVRAVLQSAADALGWPSRPRRRLCVGRAGRHPDRQRHGGQQQERPVRYVVRNAPHRALRRWRWSDRSKWSHRAYRGRRSQALPPPPWLDVCPSGKKAGSVSSDLQERLQARCSDLRQKRLGGGVAVADARYGDSAIRSACGKRFRGRLSGAARSGRRRRAHASERGGDRAGRARHSA